MDKSPTMQLIEIRFGNVPVDALIRIGKDMGLSFRQIAEDLGVSHVRLYTWADDFGIEPPGRRVLRRGVFLTPQSVKQWLKQHDATPLELTASAN